ncbi:MAG: Nif3-like dinuclear metal center hexameric protein [Gemmatimonadota bacterium]|nr:Nif3-like dinuclear metal center hexameric protein [Gemmatimonadota bacterium]
MAKALEITAFANDLLRTSEIPDYPNALNGMQIGSDAEIARIAAAVDFSERTVKGAVAAGANLLFVHHGAFWGGLAPLTGRRFDLVRSMIANSLAIYSSHLPLDCHPTLGNNVLLARKLGLTPSSGFGEFHGIKIGVAGESSGSIKALLQTASAFAAEHGGRVHATAYDDERVVGKWGICSGSGANPDSLREAAERGIQTLVVGEGPHWTAVHAEENGLVIIYAGHYATETLGVQALASAIGDEFGILWEFIAAPTGT